MQASRIIDAIQTLAPLEYNAAWDVSGVQIASRRSHCARLAVTIDPVPAAVRQAVDQGADFICTHHPLGLEPRLPAVVDDHFEVLRICLAAGVWLYAAHTTLDSNIRGPAGFLARDLNLAGTRPLEPLESSPHAGFGVVGDLAAPLSPEDFHTALCHALGRDHLVAAGPLPESVSRVAYCPGSGAGLARAARAAGADVFVTGDVKYHQAQEAPLHMVDAGHFGLEEPMVKDFCKQLEAVLEATVDTVFLPGTDPMTLIQRRRP
jgi:dinuclear metal center YbgI/SA1388 family protein